MTFSFKIIFPPEHKEGELEGGGCQLKRVLAGLLQGLSASFLGLLLCFLHICPKTQANLVGQSISQRPPPRGCVKRGGTLL